MDDVDDVDRDSVRLVHIVHFAHPSTAALTTHRIGAIVVA